MKRAVVFVDAEDSEKRRSPNGLIEGCRENLTAVFTEADTGDTFTVSTLISPQTLATLDLPHLKKKTNTTHPALKITNKSAFLLQK